MTKQEIKNLKYDKALELLKEISLKLEHCKSKLKSTEDEIKKIIQTDAPD
jgi:exonuclease VII small subunit